MVLHSSPLAIADCANLRVVESEGKLYTKMGGLAMPENCFNQAMLVPETHRPEAIFPGLGRDASGSGGVWNLLLYLKKITRMGTIRKGSAWSR